MTGLFGYLSSSSLMLISSRPTHKFQSKWDQAIKYTDCTKSAVGVHTLW